MVSLSSKRTTFFHKRVFPFLWFGFLILLIAIPLVAGLRTGRYPSLPFLIIPIGMMIFGYFLLKVLVFDLVDEAVDLGDALLIKNAGKEDRVMLSDIINVSYTRLTSPPRVTLSLRKPCLFGTEVSFCPPVPFIPFAKSPIIDPLIVRVDAARRANAST